MTQNCFDHIFDCDSLIEPKILAIVFSWFDVLRDILKIAHSHCLKKIWSKQFKVIWEKLLQLCLDFWDWISGLRVNFLKNSTLFQRYWSILSNKKDRNSFRILSFTWVRNQSSWVIRILAIFWQSFVKKYFVLSSYRKTDICIQFLIVHLYK